MTLDALEVVNGICEVADGRCFAVTLFRPASPQAQNSDRASNVLVAHIVDWNFATVLRRPKQDFLLCGLCG